MPLVKNLPVFKEQTDFGNDSIVEPPENAPDYEKFTKEKNCYPNEEFGKTVDKFYRIYHDCALLILRFLAIGIGIEENYFTDFFFENKTDQHLR